MINAALARAGLANPGRYLRRRVTNAVFILLSVGAALFGIVWLTLILYALLKEGISAMGPHIFSLPTPPPMMEGGLSNAILGSLIMSGLAVAVGTPIGLFAGTWLAEYGRHHRLSFFVRFVNDILLSAPSIVTGLFIYEVFVVRMGHFSAIAGAASLTVIVIPVVVRTTENMLLLVPNSLREAAIALGAPRSFVIKAVTWKAARAGIVTGVLLAVARISGETAPLLFTALNNQFTSIDLDAPMASLPAVIFQYAMSPYDDWHALAWAGALLVTAAVLALSILARLLERKQRT
jgi:phosphate transport system permease protein